MRRATSVEKAGNHASVNRAHHLWPVLLACVGAGCSSAVVTGSPRDLGEDPLLLGDIMRPPSADLARDPVVVVVPGVVVSTLAGSANFGSADGSGAAAAFQNPVGIALGGDGLLYVTEYDSSRVRRVTQDGAVTLLTRQSGFVGPFAVAWGGSDLVVQTDYDETGVKNTTTGTLWRVSLQTGVAARLVGGLGRPRGLAYLGPDTLAVADHMRGTLSTLSLPGGGLTLRASQPLNVPIGVAALPDGSVVVADSANHCVRRVLADNSVTTLAGDGVAGMIDGPGVQARFDRPIAITADSQGNVYVSDSGANHRIRRIDATGVVESIAGNGQAGFADGPGDTAAFYGQEGLVVLPSGGVLYVADGNSGDGADYHRIRKITLP